MRGKSEDLKFENIILADNKRRHVPWMQIISEKWGILRQ